MSTNIECAVCGSASCVDGCCAACTATGGCTHTPAPERCPDPGGCERVAGHSGLHMVRCYNCRSGQHDGVTWAALRAAGGQALNIVFDGPPGPVSGRFIEVENDAGVGVNAGEWSERPNGWWALRIPAAGGQEKPSPPLADNWHNWDCNRTNCPGCYDGPRP